MICPADDTSVNDTLRDPDDYDSEEIGPKWDCDRAYEFGDFDGDEEEDGEDDEE